eukprot:3222479-Amphidinium_carterae.1
MTTCDNSPQKSCKESAHLSSTSGHEINPESAKRISNLIGQFGLQETVAILAFASWCHDGHDKVTVVFASAAALLRLVEF